MLRRRGDVRARGSSARAVAPLNGGPSGPIRYGTPAGRWVVLATVLGSGMAALDATVVNVALPAIGRSLDTDVAGLQLVVTGYLLTLASLILLGGALGDRYGRRRIFRIGVIWFAVSSLVCGIAPNLPLLVAARALQGIGGALLTPGSLAIIEASFHRDDRGRAIGAWSGLGGLATAIGPFAGGWLIEASWRLIFLLNLPMAAIVLFAARHVPESYDPNAPPSVDVAGAASGAVGLAAVSYGLVERQPWVAVVGVAALVGFVFIERLGSHPMLPLSIFKSRLFSATNVVTFALYAALSGTFFLLAVALQQVMGYSPLEAGAAMLPVTVIMLTLSSRAGALAQRIGPRPPMTVGPILVAVAMLLLRRVGVGATYLADVLPAILVFGLGLAITVAPLTTTVLGAVGEEHAGIASGVNNAVARAAGLLAVAVFPLVGGISGEDYQHPAALANGFDQAMAVSAGLALAGAIVAWLTIRRPAEVTEAATEVHCSVGAPPLRLAAR